MPTKLIREEVVDLKSLSREERALLREKKKIEQLYSNHKNSNKSLSSYQNYNQNTAINLNTSEQYIYESKPNFILQQPLNTKYSEESVNRNLFPYHNILSNVEKKDNLIVNNKDYQHIEPYSHNFNTSHPQTYEKDMELYPVDHNMIHLDYNLVEEVIVEND